MDEFMEMDDATARQLKTRLESLLKKTSISICLLNQDLLKAVSARRKKQGMWCLLNIAK